MFIVSPRSVAQTGFLVVSVGAGTMPVTMWGMPLATAEHRIDLPQLARQRRVTVAEAPLPGTGWWVRSRARWRAVGDGHITLCRNDELLLPERGIDLLMVLDRFPAHVEPRQLLYRLLHPYTLPAHHHLDLFAFRQGSPINDYLAAAW